MPPSTSVKIIFIVDEDLGFVFSLGRLLTDAGYQVWPARSGGDAAALLNELGSGLDLLIINPNSCGAVRFVQEQRDLAAFKMIVIQEERSAEFFGADAVLMKAADEVSRFEWLGVVERLLHNGEQRTASQPV